MAGALLSFLSGLTPRQMDRLYRSPWACLAVLRALHPLAKHYVMRLLYVDDGVPIADLDAWVRPEAEETHRACVGDMRRLRVLVVSTTGGDGAASRRGDAAGDAPTAKLSARFARGLRSLYETNFRPDGEQDAAASASASLAALVPSRDALDAFSKGRWEALLLTLTGASDAFDLSARARQRQEQRLPPAFGEGVKVVARRHHLREVVRDAALAAVIVVHVEAAFQHQAQPRSKSRVQPNARVAASESRGPARLLVRPRVHLHQHAQTPHVV